MFIRNTHPRALDSALSHHLHAQCRVAYLNPRATLLYGYRMCVFGAAKNRQPKTAPTYMRWVQANRGVHVDTAESILTPTKHEC